VDRRLRYLAAMGIEVWLPRRAPAGAAGAAAEAPPSPPAAEAPTEALEWEGLAQRVAACTACRLHESRTQTVFGVGSRSADLLFIGEAPGAEEDRRGEPFVGRAGQLLNAMLAALGHSRESVYIANILKCRPPRNRDPQVDEVAACGAYLRRQIALLGPKVIVALGRVAAQNLLGETAPLARLRGRELELEDTGIPVVVTYHPAYLLRSPADKRKAWLDLQRARAMLELQR